MDEATVHLDAACSCAKNKFRVMSKPLARFICHCEVCQRFSQKPFSDVTVFLKKDIKQIDISNTQFQRYKGPPNIRRGKCSQCHYPSIEFGIFDQLAFIPTSNFAVSSSLASPSCHIFYHRRVHDVDDHLPKFSGFFSSQIQVCQLILLSTLKRISANFYGLGKRS